tara:strand:+ start:101 stop:2995 length:2895 start_codon:yes stop_codon:yes gene_type:complete
MRKKPDKDRFFKVPTELKSQITTLDIINKNNDKYYLLDFSSFFGYETHIWVPSKNLHLYDLNHLIYSDNENIKIFKLSNLNQNNVNDNEINKNNLLLDENINNNALESVHLDSHQSEKSKLSNKINRYIEKINFSTLFINLYNSFFVGNKQEVSKIEDNVNNYIGYYDKDILEKLLKIDYWGYSKDGDEFYEKIPYHEINNSNRICYKFIYESKEIVYFDYKSNDFYSQRYIDKLKKHHKWSFTKKNGIVDLFNAVVNIMGTNNEAYYYKDVNEYIIWQRGQKVFSLTMPDIIYYEFQGRMGTHFDSPDNTKSGGLKSEMDFIIYRKNLIDDKILNYKKFFEKFSISALKNHMELFNTFSEYGDNEVQLAFGTEYFNKIEKSGDLDSDEKKLLVSLLDNCNKYDLIKNVLIDKLGYEKKLIFPFFSNNMLSFNFNKKKETLIINKKLRKYNEIVYYYYYLPDTDLKILDEMKSGEIYNYIEGETEIPKYVYDIYKIYNLHGYTKPLFNSKEITKHIENDNNEDFTGETGKITEEIEKINISVEDFYQRLEGGVKKTDYEKLQVDNAKHLKIIDDWNNKKNVIEDNKQLLNDHEKMTIDYKKINENFEEEKKNLEEINKNLEVENKNLLKEKMEHLDELETLLKQKEDEEEEEKENEELAIKYKNQSDTLSAQNELNEKLVKENEKLVKENEKNKQDLDENARQMKLDNIIIDKIKLKDQQIEKIIKKLEKEKEKGREKDQEYNENLIKNEKQLELEIEKFKKTEKLLDEEKINFKEMVDRDWGGRNQKKERQSYNESLQKFEKHIEILKVKIENGEKEIENNKNQINGYQNQVESYKKSHLNNNNLHEMAISDLKYKLKQSTDAHYNDVSELKGELNLANKKIAKYEVEKPRKKEQISIEEKMEIQNVKNENFKKTSYQLRDTMKEVKDKLDANKNDLLLNKKQGPGTGLEYDLYRSLTNKKNN